MASSWEAEEVDALLAAWFEERKSAATICQDLNERFGNKFTRNSVLSKIHRECIARGLDVSRGGSGPPNGGRKPRKSRTNGFRSRVPAVTVSAPVPENGAAHEEGGGAAPVAPPPSELVVQGRARGIRTVMDLTRDTCRWPVGDVGDPDFFFCGIEPLTGLPYCAYHSRVAYQPANWRRRHAGQ